MGDATGYLWQHAQSDNYLSDLKRKVKHLKINLVQTVGEHCDSGLFALWYHLFYHVVGDEQRCKALLVLSGSLYEHVDEHIKRAFRTTLQRR